MSKNINPLQMTRRLQAQYTRLFFPAEKKVPKVGIQTPEGTYPNSTSCSFQDHYYGSKTYAFDVLHEDENGISQCKFGVLDIDDPETAFECSRQLIAKAAAWGIPLVPAYSGGKGIHCYLFVSSVVPKSAMVSVLKALAKAVPFKGDLIPGDNYRVKLPPCFHQKAQRVSYFLREGEQHEFHDSKEELKAILPDQLEIMKAIKPMDADTFMALSRQLGWDETPVDYALVTPDLKSLPHGNKLTPCMKAFLEKGGAHTLGTYDTQNLILLNYCTSAGLDANMAENFAIRFAENTNPGIATGKSYDEKMRQWRSMQGAPSAAYDFSCLRVLKARQELGFKCSVCPVRPEGIDIKKAASSDFPPHGASESKGAPETSHTLTLEMSGHLITQLMTKKAVPVNIDEDILADRIDKAIFFCLQNDQFFPTDILQFLPIISAKDLKKYLPSKLPDEPKPTVAELVAECSTRLHALRTYTMSDEEVEKLIDFARKMTLASRLTTSLHNQLTSLSDHTPPATVLENLGNDIASLQRTDQETIDNQLAYMNEFADFLEDCGQKIPTGIALLDQHLGGGLACGSLTVAASPPGGGKTTFSTQLADNVASSGIPVLYVSMEMSRNALSLRSLSRIGGIDSRILERGTKQWGVHAQRVEDALETYASHICPNLHIVEGGEPITPAFIRGAIANVRAKAELADDAPMLVVIDYLQLLDTGMPAIDNGPNETAKISSLAWMVKVLANHTHVAIVAISDVTKEEQSHADGVKGMTLGALRGSNRIAHSADYVFLMYSGQNEKEGDTTQDPWTPIRAINHRPVSEKLDKIRKSPLVTSPEGYPVLARLDIAKNRSGVKGAMIPLIYQKAFHRFLPVIEGDQSC